MQVFAAIGAFLDRVLRSGDRYALDGDCIVPAGSGYSVRRVAIDSIESWTAYPEMVFDVVVIRLRDGVVVQWLDYHNDLLTILRDHAGKLEICPRTGRTM